MNPKPQRGAAIHVVAGVLGDRANRVLLAQRPAGRHLAGAWEFPGGKIEPGETPLEGLARELSEEIGVTLEAARPLMRVRHAYPERDVELDAWVVTRYRGEPAGLDGQQLRWCPRDALAGAELLPADRPIVTALLLPERIMAIAGSRYVIRNAAEQAGAAGPSQERTRFLGALCDGPQDARGAAAAGAEFLVMRKAMEPSAVSALCASVNLPVFVREITLEDAWALGASGTNELAV